VDRSAERLAAGRSRGCGTTAHAGCSSCGIMRELARRSMA
jgi:hypothetical protein